MVRLMNTPAEVTGPINLGNSAEFTVLELAETVIELTKSRSKIVHRPLPQDDPKQRQPDLSLANKVLEWAPRTPLREGLAPTIAYFEKLITRPDVRAMLAADAAATSQRASIMAK
jgi:UDP-glucuronate decarboxylase